MKKIYTLLTFIILAQQSILAQRVCGTIEAQQLLEQLDPTIIQNRQAIEDFTGEFVAHYIEGERALVTIPVVVHVVWNTTTENISDAQIQSQINVLNADFRKLNSDAGNVPSAFTGLAADANIEFCLATVNPSGNPTTGINRVQTASTSFGTNNTVKSSSTGGTNAWDRNKYLNIWVCDISGGTLGYAQFPGGSASTDGVVIDYQYFGTTGTATAPFNKGRTGTHEVGHWLNLYHIWGDDGTGCTGSDLVSDTPNQADENYGCPTFPQVSCSNGPNGDMFMNYMDYTDDACMYMFSSGQSARMQALFAAGGARASLLTSNGCGTVVPPSCGNVSGLSVSGITQTSANVSWSAVSGATSYTLQYKTTTSSTWTTVNPTTNSFLISGLTAGTAYNVQVRAVCASGNGAYTASTFTTSASTPTCTDTYESNNTTGTAKTIPVNTNISAIISSSTDRDWFRFSNTSTQRNIRIDLTTLPADYDVRLYNPSGSQVAISQNGGTTSEVITFNTTTVGTWRVQVYGYNGAFNSSACYTLRASISASSFREGEEIATEELQPETGSATLNIASIFPNPTNGKLNIQFISVADQLVEIIITDVAGRIVQTSSMNATEGDNFTTVDMVNLENGYYNVLINDGQNKSCKMVLKQ
jgi:hypothetical protein